MTVLIDLWVQVRKTWSLWFGTVMRQPYALRILGDKSTHVELRILGALQYVYMYVTFVCYDYFIFTSWPAVWILYLGVSGH
jgi:hypothetical protein